MSVPLVVLRAWFGADPDVPVPGPIVLREPDLPESGAFAAHLAAAPWRLRSPTRLSGPTSRSPGEVRLAVADAPVISLMPYGLAPLLAATGPTLLRVCDENDFSAYLRDADEAWHTGVFPDAMTHPLLGTTDLYAVGAPDRQVGPDARLLVSADGQVRTAPSGLPLGSWRATSGELRARWRSLDVRAGRPGGVELGTVLDERDRVDALRERPWLARYTVVAAVLRRTRAAAWPAVQLLGFGPGEPLPHSPWAPVSLRRAGRDVTVVPGRDLDGSNRTDPPRPERSTGSLQ